MIAQGTQVVEPITRCATYRPYANVRKIGTSALVIRVISSGSIQGQRHGPFVYGLPVSSLFEVNLQREGQPQTGEFRIEVLADSLSGAGWDIAGRGSGGLSVGDGLVFQLRPGSASQRPMRFS